MCSVVKSDSAERTCIKRDYSTSIVCQFLERVIYTTLQNYLIDLKHVHIFPQTKFWFRGFTHT